MHYIGLMSGTSVDGIDAVVVEIGKDNKFSLVAVHGELIPASVVGQIQQLMNPPNDDVDLYGTVDMALGELFARAAATVLNKSGLERRDVRAIGSHGQTVRHRPRGEYPFTLQIGNPSVIAERTGITTVADFRARDVAAGGQGAPLVPAFHQWLFHSNQLGRAVINIGGIANITLLPAVGSVTGFDTGPGNTLLDQWAQRHIRERYDRAGQWAESGKVNEALLKQLLDDPYFATPPPKSTGREYFTLEWLTKTIGALNITPVDVQATLIELTSHSIADAVIGHRSQISEAYVCGGGSHNLALMRSLDRHLSTADIDAKTTDALNLQPDWVEASAFAWLAHRTLEGLPGNLPSVTGAKRSVILGAIYPGERQ